jgi:S-formylglutathione hydrolase FrmB
MIATQIRRAMVAATLTLVSLTPIMATAESQLVSREIASVNFARNKIGTNPVRKMVVYLPPGYGDGSRHYPVIYFLPNPLASYSDPFNQDHAEALFDHAIASKVIGDFILVTVDMATPYGCSWYVNSPVTGNWEDFMVQELVPYVDANFRTLPSRNSRGIVGDFMGGYGAIRFGMTHPEVFGSVYALHPVGTGSGIYTMYSRPDWDKLANLKSTDELPKEIWANIFLSIFQASVPNVNKAPLFIDLQAHKEGNALAIDSNITEKLRDNFLLETMIGKYADNLKSLRGFKFDWARNDGNHDHVYSNQAFTHKLNEFGIPHESEEYNGVWGGNWGEDGRVYTEVLPFFEKHLVFENNRGS